MNYYRVTVIRNFIHSQFRLHKGMSVEVQCFANPVVLCKNKVIDAFQRRYGIDLSVAPHAISPVYLDAKKLN